MPCPKAIENRSFDKPQRVARLYGFNPPEYYSVFIVKYQLPGQYLRRHAKLRGTHHSITIKCTANCTTPIKSNSTINVKKPVHVTYPIWFWLRFKSVDSVCVCAIRVARFKISVESISRLIQSSKESRSRVNSLPLCN